MNETQQQAIDFLTSKQITGLAFELIAASRTEWEFAENWDGWMQSHATAVELNEDWKKIAQGMIANMQKEVGDSLYDGLTNALTNA